MLTLWIYFYEKDGILKFLSHRDDGKMGFDFPWIKGVYARNKEKNKKWVRIQDFKIGIVHNPQGKQGEKNILMLSVILICM